MFRLSTEEKELNLNLEFEENVPSEVVIDD